ncbi:hypothetical protein A0U92_14585 [Acetobacter aceti]|uniref:Insertion element IS402-like domain-containing protein n=1 Tax=Acetobacter aceti TaxID=435 RepID=A0A1U9KJ17_ACEAC|nr:hypothetical protein A0U92_14585 [Acetobacter aceti]
MAVSSGDQHPVRYAACGCPRPPATSEPYPSDISDEEWLLIIPYLLLMKEDAEQRHHDLRELFNGLRYVIRYGIAWRAMPNDLPPWTAVYPTAAPPDTASPGGCRRQGRGSASRNDGSHLIIAPTF